MPISIIVLLVLFAGVTILDLVLAGLSFHKKNMLGRFLGGACFSAAFVTACYLISVFTEDYFLYSVYSSLYFIGIDAALLFLVSFVRHFTKGRRAGKQGIGCRLLTLWSAADMTILAVNPFCEIAIHYVHTGAAVSHYAYQMHFFYKMHLFLAYVMVVVILTYLVWKTFTVPSVYRRPYNYAILSLLLVVVINAFYLYWPAVGGVRILDYSLLGYSLAAFLFYWNCFFYMPHGLYGELRNLIFASIGQGLLLFDYNDELILENEKAEEMFAGTQWKSDPTMGELLRLLNAENQDIFRDAGIRKYSFQCYPDGVLKLRPLRCDYSALFSKKQEILGRLFVFTDLSSEYDALTGFYSWEAYQKNSGRLESMADGDTIAAACDINGLADINRECGRNGGDQAIQALAGRMRELFPEDTFFVRGREAILFAICTGRTEQEIGGILERLQESLKKNGFLNRPVGIQTAIKLRGADMSQLDTVRGAMETLRIRKILDENSRHSELLYSLIRALQECDPDTEAHVRRTQKLGAKLGRRIGLTEEEQGKLALLAILHDIGKIGIPLDILNKPGRLTEEEWNVLKTHVEKGYQIANSSEALKGIADMILAHHERWDGKGYPNGLSKESIPLLSRIISVVDAYDAMVNDRAYRPGMPKADACSELRRCAGTQFDPTLVSAFLEILKDEEDVAAAEADAVTGNPAQAKAPQEWSAQTQGETAAAILRVHVMKYSRYVLDPDYRIVQVDGEFERMTGYSAEEVEKTGLNQLDLIFEEDKTEYRRIAEKGIAEHMATYLEHRIRRKDGSAIFVFCYGRRFYDSAVRLERTEVIISDSASSYSVQSVVQIERGKAIQRLERWENKFRRDPLTGLLNHEAFKNDVETRLLSGREQALMLMMDVDHFKEYNDTRGHRAGDEFLVMTAQTLLSALRKDDFACRMGGDEFAAILFFKDAGNREQMVRRASQICDKVNLTLMSAREDGIGISMGGAFLSPGCASFDRLYEAADRALYQAKESGRGKLCFRETTEGAGERQPANG